MQPAIMRRNTTLPVTGMLAVAGISLLGKAMAVQIDHIGIAVNSTEVLGWKSAWHPKGTEILPEPVES